MLKFIGGVIASLMATALYAFFGDLYELVPPYVVKIEGVSEIEGVSVN